MTALRAFLSLVNGAFTWLALFACYRVTSEAFHLTSPKKAGLQGLYWMVQIVVFVAATGGFFRLLKSKPAGRAFAVTAAVVFVAVLAFAAAFWLSRTLAAIPSLP